MKIVGVPFAGLITMFVASADLIPLVGAALGAVVALIAAAVHSVRAVIVMVIFVIACQHRPDEVCGSRTHSGGV